MLNCDKFFAEQFVEDIQKAMEDLERYLIFSAKEK